MCAAIEFDHEGVGVCLAGDFEVDAEFAWVFGVHVWDRELRLKCGIRGGAFVHQCDHEVLAAGAAADAGVFCVCACSVLCCSGLLWWKGGGGRECWQCNIANSPDDGVDERFSCTRVVCVELLLHGKEALGKSTRSILQCLYVVCMFVCVCVCVCKRERQ